ncbi:hypothetical protein [Campylobacter devanensis]|uniref:hypothetical protein n=1 Tax=Campylobacter devanensis TaxID=3161138 RepID=UPI000A34988B|nr:hypothetical protein [Campylobacter sp. P0139]
MIGLITSAISIAASICTTVGSTLGSAGALIAKAAITIAPYVDKISSVLNTIGSLLNILMPNDKPENFGEAMRQASKKPEDFGDMKSYMNYLRDEIDNGNVDLNVERSEEDKLANQFMGYGLLLQCINEKYGISQDSNAFWGTMGSKIENEKVTPEEVLSIADKTGQSQISSEDVSNYIEGNDISSGASKREVFDVIESGLQSANPDMSSDEISAKFNELIKE